MKLRYEGLKRRPLLIPVVTVLLLALVISSPISAATNIFINEFHYDNDSTDTGEAIEVAGPAGTDLTGWTIVLYNGSSSVRAPYGTINLSGVIPDLGSGFGTLSFAKSGIQNGAPDGFALVDPSSNVVQFLSYEGSFEALSGPAAGMTSTDVGVAEGSGTPVGYSLQLVGTGTTYEDFVWAGEQPETFDAVNTGQTFSAGSYYAFINEFHYDNDSTDTGEFIELAGSAGTDLTGWSLVLYNGSSSVRAPYGTINLSGVIPDLDSGFGTLSFAKSGIQNGAPDGFALVDASSNVVQFLSYEGSFEALSGPAAGMTSTDVGVAEGSGTPVGYSLQLVGTGTTYDDFTWAGEQPETPGTVNTGQSFSGVVDLCPGAIAIADVQGIGSSTPLEGDTVTVRGYVTGDFGSNLFVQENSSDPYSGVYVYASGNDASRGDEVCVTGEATEYFDITEIAYASVDVLSSGNTLPAPAVISTADASLEQWESVLVRVENVTVDNPDIGYDEWTVDDGSGPAVIDDWGYAYTPTAGEFFTFIQGPLNYSYGAFKIAPRDADDIGIPEGPPASCSDPFTPIYEVQGNGASTPYYNQTVTIQGVVVADFEGYDSLNGFFLQDAAGDGDAATSDGVFVYNSGDNVAVGDEIRLTGLATEYYDMTQVKNVSALDVCGTGSIAPVELVLPVASVDDFEAYEGMLVTMPQALYISEYFNFDRYGEIVLTSERLFQPTALFDPASGDASDLAAANLLDRITLDDGRTSQNPDPAIHPNGNIFDLTNLFRGGDKVQNVTGVINYSHDIYRIQPVQGATYIPANPRTAQPDAVGGGLKVASFNVLNYFTTFGSRGADNQTEFDRQRDKIIAAMVDIDADVYGLIEIENNDEAIMDLVSGLNDVLGAGTYDYVDTGVVGTDEIKVAFIYKTATVSLVGDFAVLDDPAFTNPLDEEYPKNRPAVAQSFMDNNTGGIFTAVINHFKSKGSECTGDFDPLQGNCNLTRTLAAIELANWLASDPTGSGDADFLILGDLNSYDKEDPITELKAAGFTDLLFDKVGEYAYSYVFDGQVGYLDYALASADLLPEVSGVTVWHINADEPDLIDYDTTYKDDAQDAIYAPDAYRSSDHDPVITGLDVCDEIAPTATATASTEELWPANHKYVTVQVDVVASDNFDPNPTVTLLSVVSNEPDNGLGDGDTADDIVVIDDFTFDLRAERDARGDGRTYTITYSVKDACGNETIVSVDIFVPHSKSKGK